MEKSERNTKTNCLVCWRLLSAEKKNGGEMESRKLAQEIEKCYGGH